MVDLMGLEWVAENGIQAPKSEFEVVDEKIRLVQQRRGTSEDLRRRGLGAANKREP
jgi:hypothetical protein